MRKIVTPKNRLNILMLLSGICIFSGTAFAQRDAGGSADGLTPPQPCPTSFTRNNGDGTCSGEAQIRLFYSTPPTIAPTLQTILYNGEPLLNNSPIVGNLADYSTNGYVSFCLPTNNIPPAIKLTLVIYYVNTTQQECTISGTQ